MITLRETTRRRGWMWRRLLASGAVLATAVSMAMTGPGSASATDTFVHRLCWNTVDHVTPDGPEHVDFCWGFDYRLSNNHLRGYARLVARGGDSSHVHVQAQPIRLGDGNGVIAEGTGNSQTGVLDIDTSTGGVDNQGYTFCHTSNPDASYISHLFFSVRWSDGVLATFDSGQFVDDANGAPLGACTPFVVTCQVSTSTCGVSSAVSPARSDMPTSSPGLKPTSQSG